MANVEFKLDDLSVPELVALGARVADGLKDNTNFPQPPVEQLNGILQELKEKQQEYSALRLKLGDLKLERDGIVARMEEALTSTANYVQHASGGDVKKIMSANLSVEHGVDLWPFNDPKQVVELSASGGDKPGEVDLVWDPVRGADGYEIEISQDLGRPENWKPCAASSASKATLEELAGGQRFWFRVRAVNSKGVGHWSDPVTKYAS